MKMLLVVFIVLINYNEFSSAQPQFPALKLPKLTVNVEKVDVHIKSVRVNPAGIIPRSKKESGGDYAGVDFMALQKCFTKDDCPLGQCCNWYKTKEQRNFRCYVPKGDSCPSGPH